MVVKRDFFSTQIYLQLKISNQIELLFDFKSRISFCQWCWYFYGSLLLMISDFAMTWDWHCFTVQQMLKYQDSFCRALHIFFGTSGVRWCYIFIHICRFQFALSSTTTSGRGKNRETIKVSKFISLHVILSNSFVSFIAFSQAASLCCRVLLVIRCWT